MHYFHLFGGFQNVQKRSEFLLAVLEISQRVVEHRYADASGSSRYWFPRLALQSLSYSCIETKLLPSIFGMSPQDTLGEY